MSANFTSTLAAIRECNDFLLENDGDLSGMSEAERAAAEQMEAAALDMVDYLRQALRPGSLTLLHRQMTRQLDALAEQRRAGN